MIVAHFRADARRALVDFLSAIGRSHRETHWTFPAPPELIQSAQAEYSEPNAYPIDARGLAYHYAFIGLKRLGAGQFYMISIKDKQSENFDGGNTYRLSVPPNAPVEQYWSLTAYDRGSTEDLRWDEGLSSDRSHRRIAQAFARVPVTGGCAHSSGGYPQLRFSHLTIDGASNANPADRRDRSDRTASAAIVACRGALSDSVGKGRLGTQAAL